MLLTFKVKTGKIMIVLRGHFNVGGIYGRGKKEERESAWAYS